MRKGKKVNFTVSNHSENEANRRARQNKEVSVGFTLFGATVKKIWMFFCQGPICNENIFNQGPEQKNRTLKREIRFRKAKM